MSAPTTYSWVSLGQGDSMSGSNIFVMYVDSSDKNVTVSPRLGSGYSQPRHNGDAQVTVLEGSGVADGVMTANVRCANCDSWSGGSMDFAGGGSSNWIWAVKSGSALSSDDVSESISQHDSASPFTWDLKAASGGDDVNPFASGTETSTAGSAGASCVPISGASGGSTANSNGSGNGNGKGNGNGGGATKTLASPSGSGCPTAWPTEFSTNWPTAQPTSLSSCYPNDNDRRDGTWSSDAPWEGNGQRSTKRQSNDDSCPDGYERSGRNSPNSQPDTSSSRTSAWGFASRHHKMVLAHGILASIAFVALFPAGAILIRLASFPGAIWAHAAIQILAYLVYVAAFGLGVYMAMHMDRLTDPHPAIGLALFTIVSLQPPLGWLHHRLFRTHQRRTWASYAHLGFGRVAILLGMVNGGLGLAWTGAGRSAIIAYAVVAGVVGPVYLVAILWGEWRRAKLSKPSNYRWGRTTSGSADGARSDENVRRGEFYGKREAPFDGT